MYYVTIPQVARQMGWPDIWLNLSSLLVQLHSAYLYVAAPAVKQICVIGVTYPYYVVLETYYVLITLKAVRTVSQYSCNLIVV